MGITAPQWTEAMDAALRRDWGLLGLNELAANFDCTQGQVRWRAVHLGLEVAGKGAPAQSGPTLSEDEETALRKLEDRAFIAAMTAAIEAGQEHAPIGIERCPCTKNPRFIPRPAPMPRSGSPAATCAELGD
jgi:hypothetical protein